MGGYIQEKNDIYDPISGFLVIQAEHEAMALRQIAISASGFIKHDKVRYDFITNVEAFTEAQLECISGNNSHADKTRALTYLQKEQEYLKEQIDLLQSKKVQPAASVEVRIINGVLSYVVKSVGLIGGVLQILSGGLLVSFGSLSMVGTALGGMLFMHGVNNVYENFNGVFLENDDVTGPMTFLYEEAAHFMGYDRQYGKLAFAGIDLALSATTLFSTKLVPDAWRLFNYLPKDYERGFRTMSTFELVAEVIPDTATLYSGAQLYYSLPESKPEGIFQPVIPFSDY